MTFRSALSAGPPVPILATLEASTFTGTCRVQFDQPITLVGAPKLFFGTKDSYAPSQLDDAVLVAADTLEFHTIGFGFGAPPDGMGTLDYDASIDSITGPGGAVVAFSGFPCLYTNL